MTLDEARIALATLESAMLGGAESVEINGPTGRKISYQSTADMRAAADQLRRDIQRREGRPSIKYAVWSGAK
jgi:hypothetical protein